MVERKKKTYEDIAEEREFGEKSENLAEKSFSNIDRLMRR